MLAHLLFVAEQSNKHAVDNALAMKHKITANQVVVWGFQKGEFPCDHTPFLVTVC
jgi:hypothetical protein